MRLLGVVPWPEPGRRAGDEIRTRDIQLGRLMLYQLSYSREIPERSMCARLELGSV